MFATRLFASPTTKVSALLLVTSVWANAAFAQTATSSSVGWQARGSARAAQPSTANGDWRLPNGQIIPAEAAKTAPATSNTLRSSQSTTHSLREPRTLAAPTNAKPLASSRTPSAMNASAKQSAAIAQTAASIPTSRPANVTFRPTAQGRQQQPVTQKQATAPRVARAMPPTRSAASPSRTSNRVWQRMNVAMNGAEAWNGGAEDLPMPDASTKVIDSSDPFESDPNGYYVDGDMQYPGVPGGCADGCCGDACGCGDGCCEPGCGCGCGDGECCDQCCNDCFCIGPGDPESCHSVRIRVPKWQELAFFAGVQGFKGPYDQDRDSGNFGFHEGFNAGFKIPYTYAGYQIGYQSTQNQLNGDEATDDDEGFEQHFTTFGLFRRAKDGLQFGAAWDVLVEERHEETKSFHQMRSELSWVDACQHEFGFAANVGINNQLDPVDDDLKWTAADQYVLFYRFHGKRGGEGRFFAGFSDDSDGIIGSDMLLPVHDRWSVETGFTYLIPDARNGEDGASEEAWNIYLGMVWHWDCRARSSHQNPYRPLFNVANNGTLIIDSRDD